MGKDHFDYTYSSKEHKEVAKIRNKYAPKVETKIDRLRQLDAKTEQKGMIVSIILGTIGAALLGVGISSILIQDITSILAIVALAVGILGIIAAYPCYDAITKSEKRRMSDEIIRLSDEIINE